MIHAEIQQIIDSPVVQEWQRHAQSYSMIKDIDRDRVMWCSAGFAPMLGVADISKVWDTPSALYWPEDYREFHQDDWEVFNSGQPKTFAETFPNPAGGYHYIITTKWGAKLFERNVVFVSVTPVDHLIEALPQAAHEAGRSLRKLLVQDHEKVHSDISKLADRIEALGNEYG